MTQIPDQSGGWAGPIGEPAYGRPLKTSGMAIASLVCGVLSVGACCTFLPGILAITFGAIALPVIRRHEASGRGMAIGGITLGVLGLIFGFAAWFLLVRSPDPAPVPGHELRASDRAILEELRVVEPQEAIELFYCFGLFSVREGGVVLTADRIVTYDRTGVAQSLLLEDVQAISFTPAANWLDDGNFVLEGDDGRLVIFVVGTGPGGKGDRLFHRTLRQLVTKAREAAAKPPVRSQLSSEADDPD